MESVSPAQLRVDLHVTSSAPSRLRPNHPVRTPNLDVEKADGLLLPPSAPFSKTRPWTGGSGLSTPYESDDDSPQTPTADLYDLYASDVDADLTEFDG
ncbi:MAG: hypothetical protein INR71_13515, partial [Terriglobus roseus]|nr:hypothetical protein [Terriglobus roseus]